jgi:peptidoglycan hydrolase CwlO-like protein
MRNVSIRFVRWLLSVTIAYVALSSVLAVASWPQESAKNTSAPRAEQPVQDCSEAEELRKNVQRLTVEVQRLRKRVTDLEKDRQVSVIQEQLTKEEQRGEQLQLRLIDIGEKEAGFQSRVEQLNYQLRPEQIESTMSGVGSVRPEEARDEIRRRLTSEKLRIQSQLDLLRQDRNRTQASLTTTDASIQRLRQKLAEAQRP